MSAPVKKRRWLAAIAIAAAVAAVVFGIVLAANNPNKPPEKLTVKERVIRRIVIREGGKLAEKRIRDIVEQAAPGGRQSLASQPGLQPRPGEDGQDGSDGGRGLRGHAGPPGPPGERGPQGIPGVAKQVIDQVKEQLAALQLLVQRIRDALCVLAPIPVLCG